MSCFDVTVIMCAQKSVETKLSKFDKAVLRNPILENNDISKLNQTEKVRELKLRGFRPTEIKETLKISIRTVFRELEKIRISTLCYQSKICTFCNTRNVKTIIKERESDSGERVPEDLRGIYRYCPKCETTVFHPGSKWKMVKGYLGTSKDNISRGITKVRNPRKRISGNIKGTSKEKGADSKGFLRDVSNDGRLQH